MLRYIEKEKLSEIPKFPSSSPAARLDCYCIAFPSPLQIGHIWNKAWESTRKQLATKKQPISQLEHNVASSFFHPFTGERGREMLKKKRDGERADEMRTSGVCWRLKGFPAVRVTFAVPETEPWERLCCSHMPWKNILAAHCQIFFTSFTFICESTKELCLLDNFSMILFIVRS